MAYNPDNAYDYSQDENMKEPVQCLNCFVWYDYFIQEYCPNCGANFGQKYDEDDK